MYSSHYQKNDLISQQALRKNNKRADKKSAVETNEPEMHLKLVPNQIQVIWSTSYFQFVSLMCFKTHKSAQVDNCRRDVLKVLSVSFYCQRYWIKTDDTYMRRRVWALRREKRIKVEFSSRGRNAFRPTLLPRMCALAAYIIALLHACSPGRWASEEGNEREMAPMLSAQCVLWRILLILRHTAP